MKTILVQNPIKVPSRSCYGCRFYKSSEVVTPFGRRIHQDCILFDRPLNGYSKCEDCKNSELFRRY